MLLARWIIIYSLFALGISLLIPAIMWEMKKAKTRELEDYMEETIHKLTRLYEASGASKKELKLKLIHPVAHGLKDAKLNHPEIDYKGLEASIIKRVIGRVVSSL